MAMAMVVLGKEDRQESINLSGQNNELNINNRDTVENLSLKQGNLKQVSKPNLRQSQEESKNKEGLENETGNELTFQDFKYNLWPIKFLTLVKILPTEMDVKTGELRQKEGSNFLDYFFCGLWNSFGVLRIFLMVVSIIYSNIYKEKDESSQNSDIEIHRFLLSMMFTVLVICLFVGYSKSVLFQITTLTVEANGFLRNLKRVDQTQHQHQISWMTRLQKFFLSLIKRPYQINLLIYLPFLIYSLLPAYFILAILDHNLPIFLISYADKLNSSSPFLFSSLAFLDCLFYFFIVSLIYYGPFTMLVGIVVTQQDVRNAIKILESPDGLEKARKSLIAIKLILVIFNTIGSTTVYMAKVVTLTVAIVGAFGAMRMHTNPLLATIYFSFFVMACVIHTMLFDRVYRIPERIEELKEKIIIKAQNTNFRDGRKREEYKKFCRSVQRLGIKAGGFYLMERETTLIFGDFVIQKVVDLLLTF